MLSVMEAYADVSDGTYSVNYRLVIFIGAGKYVDDGDSVQVV